MKYAVTAMCVDPGTGDIIAQPREEIIDTETNDLFRGASGPWEVEDVYHSFWNRLNPSWETDFPTGKEKVVVLSVEPAR